MSLSTDSWRFPPEDLHLGEGESHIWRISLEVGEDAASRLRHLLTRDERDRANRFRFAKDRVGYLVSHGALREILSLYTGIPASALSFDATPHGKPFLPGEDLEFSLSHSGAWALVTVTPLRSIGVDVERIRPVPDLERLAEQFFSKEEVRALQAYQGATRTCAFYHCWTRKEAYIKAVGEGLSIPLDRFSVSVDPNQTDVRLARDKSLREGEAWVLRGFSPGSNYAAAVAVEGTAVEFSFWEKGPDM